MRKDFFSNFTTYIQLPLLKSQQFINNLPNHADERERD